MTRNDSDYYFARPGLDIFFTIITLNIYGIVVSYRLMQRMRDHNSRRLELLDAANSFVWEQATSRGLAAELHLHFQRDAANLDVLRRMTADMRNPGMWALILLGGWFCCGIYGLVVVWMVGL